MDSLASCPFCDVILPQSELQRHANSHFEEADDEQFTMDMELGQELAFASSSSTCFPEESMDERVSCLIALQVRSSFYHVKVEGGGGLMALLRKRLELDTDNACTSTVFLAGYVDHFQSMFSEDVGWGCGWRNIQMLSSHLLSLREDARQLLFGGFGFVPDIPYLQRWLEIAWERGFDTFGAQHFNHSVYGSKKWIGATECAALFRSFGFRARIVDFGPKEVESLFLSVPGAHMGSQVVRTKARVYGPMDRYLVDRNSDVSQPDFTAYANCRSSSSHLAEVSNQTMTSNFSSNNEGHQVLLDWVWNYFSQGSSTTHADRCHVTVTDRTPLYFQHDGHSRTIVGIEVRHQKNGKLQFSLLILDPGHLCYIDPGVASGDEMEKLKTMDSAFIEF
ncbi:uncharacterized protein LOC110635007 isoform X2 [Hevea brasiliensis]|uniref:uncharacterized protein LOC110635007 isoform X2 n=1 Tax=Hevea brasiliensis TaxID=3981 RepID=UPI0025FCDB4C|nr:uncharacterized protein LOC110635007 isoform X2 [Hevea brasiliensis]